MSGIPQLGRPIDEVESHESQGSSNVRNDDKTAVATPVDDSSRSVAEENVNENENAHVPKKLESRSTSDSDESSSDSTAHNGKDDWSYEKQLRVSHGLSPKSNLADLQQDQELLKSRGLPEKRSLPLLYKHLSVRGVGGADEVLYGPTVGGIIAPWTNIKYKKKAGKLAEARAQADTEGGGDASRGDDMTYSEKDGKKKKGEEGLRKGERYLIKDFTGLVKPGEMMLVVGRPGSGCTTFLKALSGLHSGYAGVDGEIHYGTMNDVKSLHPYKADVIFNSEEDLHDANLLVGRTLDFALRNNTPAPTARLPKEHGGEPMSAKEYLEKTKGELLKVFGLEHTPNTKVGDQYVRGVSGK